MLSHSLTGTVTATLALAAFAIGCSQQPVASTDEQFIGEAKCSAEEYEPLVACAAEPCDGLAGDPLSECIANNCDESVFEVRESCAACIVHNLSGIDDIVRACGAAPPPSTACLDTEMAPLVECAAQPCVGLAGDPLMACISDSCPSSVFEVTESCAHCILSNQSSIGAMASACTAETKPATACSADEVDPIVSCAAEPCAGLAGDPLMECMDQSCPESVWEISEVCGACMIANQSSVEAMARACGAGDSSTG